MLPLIYFYVTCDLVLPEISHVSVSVRSLPLHNVLAHLLAPNNLLLLFFFESLARFTCYLALCWRLYVLINWRFCVSFSWCIHSPVSGKSLPCFLIRVSLFLSLNCMLRDVSDYLRSVASQLSFSCCLFMMFSLLCHFLITPYLLIVTSWLHVTIYLSVVSYLSHVSNYRSCGLFILVTLSCSPVVVFVISSNVPCLVWSIAKDRLLVYLAFHPFFLVLYSWWSILQLLHCISQLLLLFSCLVWPRSS